MEIYKNWRRRMEHIKWKKDETPYLIYSCIQCQQYFYVKTTQKTKKCQRCRRIHKVKKILLKGKIVYGITTAVKRVKELQNTKGDPQFSTENEFAVFINNRSDFKQYNTLSMNNENYEERFHVLLTNLSLKYKEFPLYMIEIIANDYDIPQVKLKLLLRNFIKKGILFPGIKRKTYYRYSNE